MRIKMIKKQNGASLIEAIVSLLVFSIGVLGITALQTVTLVRSGDVKQRSVAIWKAQEIVDRIRSTRTIDNPNGLVGSYKTVIGGDVDEITSFATRSNFSCPVGAGPQRCDDVHSSTASQCSADETVASDVWTILCDPDSGISDDIDGGSDGINRLKGLDVVLTDGSIAGESFLYMSWVSQSSDKNEEIQTPGGSRTIETDLCGQLEDVDSRIDAYCLRFF